MSPICPGLNGISYEVAMDPEAISYQWSYSGTGVTINNNGQHAVTLDFATNATAGILSVNYSTVCNPEGISTSKSIVKASEVSCAVANNCLVENLLVLNGMISFPGGINLFKASNRVSSFATIESSESVIFRAGQDVSLLPFFEVESGAQFLAEIEGCFENLVPAIEKQKK